MSGMKVSDLTENVCEVLQTVAVLGPGSAVSSPCRNRDNRGEEWRWSWSTADRCRPRAWAGSFFAVCRYWDNTLLFCISVWLSMPSLGLGRLFLRQRVPKPRQSWRRMAMKLKYSRTLPSSGLGRQFLCRMSTPRKSLQTVTGDAVGEKR